MNQLILLGTIVLSLTTACSNSSQPNNDDKSINQNSATKDTSNTLTNKITQKITPSLWVETTDAKAVVDRKYKNPPEAGGGDFETAIMEINGIEFNILAAGPYFKFNESVSFVINCKDQEEVDYYWNALTANGGQESSCGWCKDKYGLSWQVVPVEYFDLINSEDPKVRDKAMQNTLKQKKIILSELK